MKRPLAARASTERREFRVNIGYFRALSRARSKNSRRIAPATCPLRTKGRKIAWLMRLGIDFGTTRTVIAAVDEGRYPVAQFETAQGYSDFVPGLAANSHGKLELGWEAAARFNQNPDGALRSIKRAVSRVSPDEVFAELGMAQTSAVELLAAYLTRIRSLLVEQSNLDISPDETLEAMVAVPANASTRQRYLTIEAFRRAGFDVVGMVNEPTAAAIEFAHRNLGVIQKRSPKRYVVVYDLGGGTFDTSAVSLEHRRFELIASEGIGELGGDDFDQLIFEFALREAKLDPHALNYVERARLLELCREAKEALSPSSRRMLIDLGRVLPAAESITLDLADLYEATRPLIDRSLSLLERVFGKLEERYRSERRAPTRRGVLGRRRHGVSDGRQNAARALQTQSATGSAAARRDRR